MQKSFVIIIEVCRVLQDQLLATTQKFKQRKKSLKVIINNFNIVEKKKPQTEVALQSEQNNDREDFSPVIFQDSEVEDSSLSFPVSATTTKLTEEITKQVTSSQTHSTQGNFSNFFNTIETSTVENNNEWLQWIQKRPKLNSLLGVKFEAQDLALISTKLLPILEILDLLK